jgi:hypothetical protein
MRDAFGVERPEISKGLFKPAAMAVKHEFRPGFGSGPVRRYLTQHFPSMTKAGRNQLKVGRAKDAAARADRVETTNQGLAASRRHDRWMASQRTSN